MIICRKCEAYCQNGFQRNSVSISVSTSCSRSKSAFHKTLFTNVNNVGDRTRRTAQKIKYVESQISTYSDALVQSLSFDVAQRKCKQVAQKCLMFVNTHMEKNQSSRTSIFIIDALFETIHTTSLLGRIRF